MTAERDPIDVIDAFLDALRSELRSNPEMAYRLVKALPVEVSFNASEVVDLVNAIEVVAEHGPVRSKTVLDAFKIAELKKIARGANLATADDMSRVSKDRLIDMIVERAAKKIAERSPTR